MTGDGLLIEFPSVVEAVASAIAVQKAIAEWNADIPRGNRIGLVVAGEWPLSARLAHCRAARQRSVI